MWHKIHQKITSHPTAMLISLLVFVFVVRLILAGLILPLQFTEDRSLKFDRWGEIARNVAEGYGYVFPYQGEENAREGAPNARRGPAPVFFLTAIFWLFGYKLWPVMIANWLVDVGIAYLLYLIAKEIFPKRLYVAYLAIFLWAIYVPEIYFTNLALSEPIFAILWAAHIWTVLKLQKKFSWQTAALSGFLLGLATLARPITLGFLPLVWLFLLIAKGINRNIFDFAWLKNVVTTAIILTGAFVLTIVPWTVRNYIVFNEFIPVSASLGITLMWDHYYLDDDDFVRQINPEQEIRAAVEKDLQLEKDSLLELSPTAADNVYRDFALEKIKAHPGRYLIVSGFRFLRLWFNIGYGEPPSTASYIVMIINSIFLGLAIAGFTWFRGDWVQKSIPILGVIAFNVLVHVFIIALIRYIMPVMPYVLMFSAYALVRAVEITANTLRVHQKMSV